jgi:hypothetical protein
VNTRGATGTQKRREVLDFIKDKRLKIRDFFKRKDAKEAGSGENITAAQESGFLARAQGKKKTAKSHEVTRSTGC